MSKEEIWKKVKDLKIDKRSTTNDISINICIMGYIFIYLGFFLLRYELREKKR